MNSAYLKYRIHTTYDVHHMTFIVTTNVGRRMTDAGFIQSNPELQTIFRIDYNLPMLGLFALHEILKYFCT